MEAFESLLNKKPAKTEAKGDFSTRNVIIVNPPVVSGHAFISSTLLQSNERIRCRVKLATIDNIKTINRCFARVLRPLGPGKRENADSHVESTRILSMSTLIVGVSCSLHHNSSHTLENDKSRAKRDIWRWHCRGSWLTLSRACFEAYVLIWPCSG